MKRALFVAAGVLAILGVYAQQSLPGITKKDPFPSGCVSCHVKLPDGTDVRMNQALKAVKRHPNVAGMMKTVPKDCMRCHGPSSKFPLSSALHKMHYGGEAKSVFVQKFGGDCLNCHTFDKKSGRMLVKSGARNW